MTGRCRDCSGIWRDEGAVLASGLTDRPFILNGLPLIRMYDPSSENESLVTIVSTFIICSAIPVVGSHRWTVLSNDADAISLPSGEKATDMTLPLWPLSVDRAAPVAGSHRRTVLSYDADATSFPSGEKATDLTTSSWPLSVD